MLTGECLSGALWWEDLMQLAEEVGFSPPRFVSGAAIKVFNKEMQDILGLFFYSCTIIVLLLGYQCCGNLARSIYFLSTPFGTKATSNSSQPLTACSKFPGALVNPVRWCTRAASLGWRRALAWTLSTPSRSVGLLVKRLGVD